jgi:DNA-binding NarL/FixJ family response regulator
LLPIENAGTPRAGSRGLTEGRLGQQEHDTSGTTAAVDGPLALASLTGREQAVLKRVSEGWSNQQIALHLNCSVGSVKATIQQLFRKLGVRKRAQIVRLAFEKALIHQ